jgi:hypothetical protein
MSINNNRPFFRDSITDDWTKKDWALNLIPLGGIASVAYEIGSACLSSRDRTAKISEDFFKSPIQTTLKKIAQCFWVPIIAYGVLKLVCFIVKACWNRCFPSANKSREESQVIDPRAKDPCINLPPEVVVNHIFSYLNLHELGVSRSVSKIWNEYASTPILWQSAIYREIAFSSENWAQWGTDFVKDVNMRQEMLSLPKNIAEELGRSAFPGKNIRETHVLVRMPKELTIKKLGELAKKYFPSNANGYRYIWSAIVDELGDKPADESIWLLMTKDVLPGSRNKSYSQQKTIIDELAKTTRVPYQVPITLEAATCILAEYFRSENRLFSDSPWTCTRCQENVQSYQVVVGGFTPAGLAVGGLYKNDNIGIAALRKF